MKGFSFLKKEKKFEVKEYILLVLLIINVASVFYLMFSKSIIYFDSDVATANLLSREQVFTKDLFPSTWVYGQDVWTFFVNVPMIFFGMFIKDQLLLRSVCVSIYSCVFIILLYFFSTKIFKDRSWLISISFLFSFISSEYMAHMFFQAAYLYQIMLLLAVFFFLAQSLNEKMEINYKNLIIGGIILCISLVNGIRNVAMILIPLIGSFILEYIIDHNKDDFRTKIKPDLIKFIKWFCFVLVFSIVGLLIFSYIKNRNFFMSGVTGSNLPGFSQMDRIMEKIPLYFASLWEVFGGVNYPVPLLSPRGVISLIRLLISLLVMFVIPILLTRKIKEQSLLVRRFIIFSWIILLISSCLFIFGENLSATRYLIMPLVTQGLVVSFYLYKYCFTQKTILSFISVCLAFFTILLSFSNSLVFQRDSKNVVAPKSEIIENIKQDLLSRNLTMGYATYWNAYSNATFFNYDIEIAAIDSSATFNAFLWLTTTRYYETSLNDKEQDTFLWLSGDESEMFESNGELQKRLGPYSEKIEYPEYDSYIYVYDYHLLYKIYNRVIDQPITDLLEDISFSKSIKYNQEEGALLPKDGAFSSDRYSLEKGRYKIHIDLDGLGEQNVSLTVADADGGIMVGESLTESSNNVEFYLGNPLNYNIYFTLENNQDSDIIIKSFTLEKIEE